MNEEIRARKIALRKVMRNNKDFITEGQKFTQSRSVFAQMELLPQFQDATTVLIYWALDDELPTKQFIEKWSSQKQILLPVVVDNDLEIRLFTGMNDLVSGSFGILEPMVSESFSGNIDFVVVPGMAFDRNMCRLGRGKGFYDRFLKTTNAFKCGVCFDFQLVDEVPVCEDDVLMDCVICGSK